MSIGWKNDPPLVQPPPSTPLVLRLTRAELLQVKGLLSECPFGKVAPLMAALCQQTDAQLAQGANALALECTYADVLDIYGLLAQCAFVKAAPIVEALCRQTEPQLAFAAQAQTESPRGSVQ